MSLIPNENSDFPEQTYSVDELLHMSKHFRFAAYISSTSSISS